MKSYTDLEQSKKLAEILPVESADMFYNEEPDETYPKDIVDTKYPMVIREEQKHYLEEYGIPCWSLAALLEILPEEITDDNGYNILINIEKYDLKYRVSYFTDLNWSDKITTDEYESFVDACYEMILKLHEQKLL